jgi:hypothetical protein
MLNGTTYTPTETVGGRFNTFDSTTGEPITLAGTPSLRLERLRAGVWSEITGDGITLAVDEDDTGRHEFAIDLDDANIDAEAGDLYIVALNAGTVDGNPVVGVEVGHFFVEADGLTTQQKADVNAEVDTAVAGLATTAAVDDLPTNSELATALAAADDAVLAAVAALNDLSAAQVNAQVLDVLSVDTFAELSGTPGASPTLATILMWLYMKARNELDNNGTIQQVKQDDGTVISEAAVSVSGGTATRGKYANP